MKKTLTVNLSGIVYNIDEDAYRLLDNYLNNLRRHFSRQAGCNEIVGDIESRMSELLGEKLHNGKQVITIEDVEDVIGRIGKPEEMDREDVGASAGDDTKESGKQEASQHATPKHFYRNPDDRMLGGVFGGLAVYTGWDVTLIRLLALILLFFGKGFLIPIYIAFWIVVPEARDAAEKLSMHGEAVTLESIGKTVTDGFDKATKGVNEALHSPKTRSKFQRLGDGIVSFSALFLKACLLLVAICLCPALFCIALLLVALLILTVASAIGGMKYLYAMLPMVNWSPIASVSPLLTLLGTIGGMLFVGIPLGAITYLIFKDLFHWKPVGSGWKWTFLILWIIGLVAVVINLIALNWQLALFGIHPA